MVGPRSQISSSEKNASTAEVASSAKPESLAPSATAPAPAIEPAPVAQQPVAQENEKSSLSQAIPISLSKEAIATGEAKDRKADEFGSAAPPAENENRAEPSRRLVPVASDAFAAGAMEIQSDEIRRLPPLAAETANPSARYAAEYPPLAVPIYPSTGK
jgi:hypothetical protein